MTINFFFQETTVYLTERHKLKSFIKKLFKREKKNLSALNYIFCTDKYLLDINRRFLKHDYYTDIITFNLSDHPQTIEGEVYISNDRVRDNAKKIHTSIKDELHRVIFHGALHLCGYNDKTTNGKKAMTSAENKYLKMYFS